MRGVGAIDIKDPVTGVPDSGVLGVHENCTHVLLTVRCTSHFKGALGVKGFGGAAAPAGRHPLALKKSDSADVRQLLARPSRPSQTNRSE